MWWLLLLAAVAIAVLFWWRRQSGGGRVGKLKEAYRHELRVSKPEADRILESQLQRMRERYPDKDEVWHLEKLLYELERDRR